MSETKFFWLHLKKCAGQSFRESFTPPYIQTKRSDPKTFIALPREEWNDVLNNYRIPLGEYDYRRMLFAKTFLYSPQDFDNMFKFVIVRNPYDRAISLWKYLLRSIKVEPKYLLMKYSLVHFLEELPAIWKSKRNRSFATHTAPIWPDISDENGELLVDKIYRLEKMQVAIEDLNIRLGTTVQSFSHANKNRGSSEYRKFYSLKSRKLVEKLYGHDIQYLEYEF